MIENHKNGGFEGFGNIGKPIFDNNPKIRLIQANNAKFFEKLKTNEGMSARLLFFQGKITNISVPTHSENSFEKKSIIHKFADNEYNYLIIFKYGTYFEILGVINSILDSRLNTTQKIRKYVLDQAGIASSELFAQNNFEMFSLKLLKDPKGKLESFFGNLNILKNKDFDRHLLDHYPVLKHGIEIANENLEYRKNMELIRDFGDLAKKRLNKKFEHDKTDPTLLSFCNAFDEKHMEINLSFVGYENQSKNRFSSQKMNSFDRMIWRGENQDKTDIQPDLKLCSKLENMRGKRYESAPSIIYTEQQILPILYPRAKSQSSNIETQNKSETIESFISQFGNRKIDEIYQIFPKKEIKYSLIETTDREKKLNFETKLNEGTKSQKIIENHVLSSTMEVKQPKIQNSKIFIHSKVDFEQDLILTKRDKFQKTVCTCLLQKHKRKNQEIHQIINNFPDKVINSTNSIFVKPNGILNNTKSIFPATISTRTPTHNAKVGFPNNDRTTSGW